MRNSVLCLLLFQDPVFSFFFFFTVSRSCILQSLYYHMSVSFAFWIQLFVVRMICYQNLGFCFQIWPSSVGQSIINYENFKQVVKQSLIACLLQEQIEQGNRFAQKLGRQFSLSSFGLGGLTRFFSCLAQKVLFRFII